MKFIKPCEGRLTSGFRTEDRPDHHGIDLAHPGLVEVIAAAGGTVIRSYTSETYGEVVFVKHTINGQKWETVYAHLRKGSRTVNGGDIVNQGDLLGYMGNTGRSFGQHLHFELHKGAWNINKTEAVDPMNYLDKDAAVKAVYCKVKGKYLHLPADAATWRVYPMDKQPVKGNEKGTLKPKKFGGLKYEILGQTGPDVYIIKSGDFGRVQIYAHPSTGATIK